MATGYTDRLMNHDQGQNIIEQLTNIATNIGNLGSPTNSTTQPITDNSVHIATTGFVHALKESLLYGNAGAHNTLYRGKYLGNALTDAQSDQIKAGTFDDLYLGDYWTINGVNYRIAGFDCFLRCGDSQDLTTHHVVVVPDTTLYSAQMNTTDTTDGGYVNSAMYKTNLDNAKTTFTNAFGADHILSHRMLLCNAASSGIAGGWAWSTETVQLMNEAMVYGVRAWGGASQNGHDIGERNFQLPLMAANQNMIHTRYNYWLTDIQSAANFAHVNTDGSAVRWGASDSFGVRPFSLVA